MLSVRFGAPEILGPYPFCRPISAAATDSERHVREATSTARATLSRMQTSTKTNTWQDIEGQLIAEGGPLRETEKLILDNLLAAQRRLDQLDAIIQAEGVTVSGSKGQLRPHPLLTEQRALRGEIARGIETLRRDRANELMIEQANANDGSA